MPDSPLQRYIEAWNRNDTEAILAVVTDDAVVVESHGPVYRGAGRIRQWADTWFARGGRVHRWEITDLLVTGDRVVAQWRFDHHWEGADQVLDGCTVACTRDGRVAELREYATMAPLYDWTGEWR